MINEIGSRYNSINYPKISNVKKNAEMNDVSKGNTEDYYKNICDKFQNLNVTFGNYTKGTVPGSGNENVMISPEYMRKAARDPKIAAELEKTLDGIPQAISWFKNQCKLGGMELISSGSVIDKDGNMSSWSYTRTSSGNENDKKVFSKSRKETDLSRLLRRNIEYEKSEAIEFQNREDEISEENRIKQIKSYSQYESDTLRNSCSNYFNKNV